MENGKEIQRRLYFPTEWKDVVFPLQAAHPKVLNATQEAMARRLFDELGVVGSRPRRDPIVVGRIHGPGGRSLQFFVAWWMGPQHLP